MNKSISFQIIEIFGTKYWSHNEQYLFEKKIRKRCFQGQIKKPPIQSIMQ